jgi:hypothetical protein
MGFSFVLVACNCVGVRGRMCITTCIKYYHNESIVDTLSSNLFKNEYSLVGCRTYFLETNFRKKMYMVCK